MEKFSIEIWDFNYSLAFTCLYTLSNDSLTITRISGIKNEKDSFLFRYSLKKDEQKKISKYLSSQNFDSLKNNYETPLIDDGDRKRIKIRIGDSALKTIDISNYYQKNLGELFDYINQIIPIPIQFKIKYVNPKQP
ncbi:MAG: hypothetical protein ABI237_18180 [Ginsengibacter sp.]